MARKSSRLERLRLALRYYNRGWQAVVPTRTTKAAPFLWPSWRRGTPQWSIIDVNNYIAEGFELNALIYTAIMYKYRAIAKAPLRAYHGTPEQPEPLPPEAPLSRLCSRPNPWQSWKAFQGLADIYLNIAGNCFIFSDREKAEVEGVPAAMYTLRPDRMTIIPDEGTKPALKGYVYVPEGRTWQDGVPILPQDMMHVKLPNARDPLEGLGWGTSPITPLAQSADVDNDITTYLKLFFEEGAMPAGLLSTDDTFLSPEDVARLRDRWNESYGGVDNWSEPVIMEKGMKYQRLSLSFDEMGFEALDSRNETRIVAPFGVPIILLETRGSLGGATYSNKEEARRMFWEDTMTWELGLFEDEYKYFLNPQDGTFVSFDLSKVPALQRDIPQLVTATKDLWSIGVPLNTAAATVGLQLADTVPTGDVGYLPINVMPAMGTAPPVIVEGTVVQPPPQLPSGSEDTEAGAPAPEEDEEEERREGKSWTPEAKAQHWKRFDRIAQSWEARFEQAAKDVFEKERRDLLALLSKVKEDARRKKQTVNWTSYAEEVEEYLKEAGDEWRSTFLPLVKGVVNDQGLEWAAQLGMQFDVQNLEAIGWFDSYMFDYWEKDIGPTTRKSIGGILQQAQREGWSVPDMQKNLTQTFRQWMNGGATAEEFAWLEERLPLHRTAMISRTEIIKSSNAGTQQIFTDWNIKEKEWLSTQDLRVRTLANTGGKTDHSIVNGQVRLQQDAFDVGGEKLMYPGDPSGSPWNVIMCRCTTIPVLPEGL